MPFIAVEVWWIDVKEGGFRVAAGDHFEGIITFDLHPLEPLGVLGNKAVPFGEQPSLQGACGSIISPAAVDDGAEALAGEAPKGPGPLHGREHIGVFVDDGGPLMELPAVKRIEDFLS